MGESFRRSDTISPPAPRVITQSNVLLLVNSGLPHGATSFGLGP